MFDNTLVDVVQNNDWEVTPLKTSSCKLNIVNLMNKCEL
jgi:hypothetical protein